MLLSAARHSAARFYRLCRTSALPQAAQRSRSGRPTCLKLILLTFPAAAGSAAAPETTATPENPATEVAKPAAAEMDPAENAEAQPTGFTFFKRKSAATEPRSAPAHDMSSGGDANGADAADAAGDDAVLAGLEQEMLATRQLYLDGMISKEVYVSETRALYQKAQTRMT